MGLSEHTIFTEIQKKCNAQGTLYAGHLLQRAYSLYPHKLALIAPSHRLTYKTLFFRALLMSKLLQECGVQKNDNIIIFYENTPEFYIAYFGIWQLGAVCVPVNTFLHERELAYIINDAKPPVIITSPTLRATVDSALALDTREVKPIVLSGTAFDWASPEPDILPIELLELVQTNISHDSLCALLYTSGTTGIPKGVMLSSRNIMTNAMQCFARFTIFGMQQDERFFCVLPLFHVFAQNVCLWLPMIIGATVILVQKIDRKLILEGLAEKPTLFFGVPPLYGLLCLMKTAPLDSVKIFVSGADMLPDKIRAGFGIIYGRKICTGYGLSEASPVVAVDHENRAVATSVVGKPLDGIDVEIRSDDGLVLSPGDVGSLWIRGNNIMMGYYNAPEATKQVLQDNWLNTGDLASIDLQGNLAIRGRSKDIIIHKGFNIYPAEVENVLMMHPAVFKAAVVGQEEDMAGQVPVAFVAIRPGTQNIEQVLRTLCAGNLATYKVPRKIICLDDLPMNATGKIDKKKLTLPNI
jgi:long-chain acyl-CoA synthetase